jgi:exportin-7
VSCIAIRHNSRVVEITAAISCCSFINEVFRTQRGLTEAQNYHEFCRLLSRLKTNYQLSELVAADEYEEFISSVADFTVESFAAWKWAGNSVHYLLSLWDRLVSSIPYVRSEKPHLLETHSPGITEAYITSCVNSVEEVLREGLDNPLEDIDALVVVLRLFWVIARCQFDLTCAGLIEMLDPLVVR